MFHSITGCDTTSYYHYRGKTDPWKRVVKCPSSLMLIEDLGKDETPSDVTITNCMEFVRSYVYCGKPNEDLVATKVRMYNDQAVKKSSTLPPDLNSLRHDILSKYHQAYTWRRCTERIIIRLPTDKYSWKKFNGVIIVPLWYTCPQLPKCLRKYDKSGYAADNEELPKEIEGTKDDRTIDIEEPVIPTERLITLSQLTNVEPPAKRFRQELRKRLNQDSVKSARDDDSYSADDEYALESTEWQNDTSDSNDWEKLSEFSDTDSSSGSDWVLY